MIALLYVLNLCQPSMDLIWINQSQIVSITEVDSNSECQIKSMYCEMELSTGRHIYVFSKCTQLRDQLNRTRK